MSDGVSVPTRPRARAWPLAALDNRYLAPVLVTCKTGHTPQAVVFLAEPVQRKADGKALVRTFLEHSFGVRNDSIGVITVHAPSHVGRTAVFCEPLGNFREINAQFGASPGQGHLQHGSERARKGIELIDRQFVARGFVELHIVEAMGARGVATVGYKHQQVRRHLSDGSNQPPGCAELMG